jgi:nucleoside-diphosphate kinase
MEQSLVLIKPDAMQRGLAGTIISRLERRGLKIVALKMVLMDSELAGHHYAAHKEKPFFRELLKFITSSPLIAIVFEGEKAVEVIRQTMGSTNAAEAAPGTIRGDYGIDLQQNLVHGSDSAKNAKREIAIFFSSGEIFSYRRDMDKWVTGS